MLAPERGWREKGVREGGYRSVTSFRHVKLLDWPRQLDYYSHSVIHSAMLLIRTAYWPTIGDTHSKQVVGHNTYDIYSFLIPLLPWLLSALSRLLDAHSPHHRTKIKVEAIPAILRVNVRRETMATTYCKFHLHKRNRTLVVLLSRETHSQYQHNRKSLVSQSKTVNYADLRENVHLVYTLPAIMFISFSFLYSIENTILGHMLDKVVY